MAEKTKIFSSKGEARRLIKQNAVSVDGEKITGNAGDMIYIPKNSTIQFSAPKYAKFFYVTYPADWSEQ